jgi:hypothetical protein
MSPSLWRERYLRIALDLLEAQNGYVLHLTDPSYLSYNEMMLGPAYQKFLEMDEEQSKAFFDGDAQGNYFHKELRAMWKWLGLGPDAI